MKLHTVFVTFNRLELTTEAIASYLETVSVPFSLVIVDNGSTDGTERWLKRFRVDNSEHQIMLLGKNLYPGYACNRGWELAPPDADFLHRSDNDWRYLPGWCKEVEAQFRNDRIGQVGLRTDKEECFPDGRTVPWNVGGNNVIRRTLWDKGLRYDERLWTEMPKGLTEDSFFSPAVTAMGYRWVRVRRKCIEGISKEDLSDPYYQKSWADRRIDMADYFLTAAQRRTRRRGGRRRQA